MVVVFDDLQWGEQTFLDLIESTALLSVGAPCCSYAWPGRSSSSGAPPGPRRSIWSRSRPTRTDALIGRALPEDLRRRISRELRAEIRFSSPRCSRSGDATAASSRCRRRCRRCSSARLDRLEPRERSRARARRGRGRGLPPRRRASARPGRAGRCCHGSQRSCGKRADPPGPAAAARRGRVPLLSPPDPRCGLRLAPEGDARRRCTSSSPAGSSSAGATASIELDEILGYHLAQAYRYRAELGRDDDETRALGERAATGSPPPASAPTLEATSARRPTSSAGPPPCFPSRAASGSRSCSRSSSRLPRSCGSQRSRRSSSRRAGRPSSSATSASSRA